MSTKTPKEIIENEIRNRMEWADERGHTRLDVSPSAYYGWCPILYGNYPTIVSVLQSKGYPVRVERRHGITEIHISAKSLTPEELNV